MNEHQAWKLVVAHAARVAESKPDADSTFKCIACVDAVTL